MLRNLSHCRPPAVLVILASLALLPARTGDARAAEATDSGFIVSARPTEVVATAGLMWRFQLTFSNVAHGGFYTDSASCRIEDTGSGGTGAPKVEIIPLTALATSLGSMSEGDSSVVEQSVPATFESGVMTYSIWGHRADGTLVAASSPQLELKPGPVSTEHPSEFVEAGGHKVEVVLFRSAKGDGSPGLLFAHPEGSQARREFLTGMQYAARGYTVMLVSMPGCGLSEGKPDQPAEATAAALAAAYDRLAKTPGVDARHIAAWGVSKSADAVARLAGIRKSLAAVVLQSGVYDARTSARGTGSKAAALILHGDADPVAPVARANALARAWRSSGADVEAKILPGAGHDLPRPEVARDVAMFLQAKLHE